MTIGGEQLPESEVTHYWNTVKQIVSGWSHDVSQIPMPRNLEIHTKVSARDFVRFIRAHHKEAREKGAMKEYGEIPPYLEISGLIHAGWRVPDDVEPTIILVRKGAPDVKATICHEMLHIFEDYLRLPPGTLEKENLEMQRRGGVYFD